VGRVRAVPRLCKLYLGICLNNEKNARKTSVRVAEMSQVALWKEGIHNRTYITIRLYGILGNLLRTVLCRDLISTPLHPFYYYLPLLTFCLLLPCWMFRNVINSSRCIIATILKVRDIRVLVNSPEITRIYLRPLFLWFFRWGYN